MLDCLSSRARPAHQVPVVSADKVIEVHKFMLEDRQWMVADVNLRAVSSPWAELSLDPPFRGGGKAG